MSRTPRPPETTRSEHWLRLLINKRPDILNSRLRELYPWAHTEEITWISPIESDDYAEYRDDAFLNLLGIASPSLPLTSFWPTGGPRWDGLGRTSTAKPLLIEAKAYIEEMVSTPTSASEPSLSIIQSSLREVQQFLRATPPHDWSVLFYQYANRLAHLYYLRERNGIDAYLIQVYFVGAPDVEQPSTASEWRAALRVLKRCLGIHNHRLSPYVAEVFIDVSELNAA